MDKKIKQAIQCLYAQAGLTALMYIFSVYQYTNLKNSLDAYPLNAGLGPEMGLSFLSVLGVFPVVLMFVCLYAAKELKQRTKWSWILALSAFLLTATSVGVIISIIGGVALLHREVREHFFKEMELSLD
jgi:ATP/ADP translocase